MASEADTAYMSSPQAARLLGITGVGVAQLVRQGKIPAVKIANRWLIPRGFLEEFARTYEGKRGRPRKVRSAGCPGAATGVEEAAGLQVALWPEAGAEAAPAEEMVVEPAAPLELETAAPAAEPAAAEPAPLAVAGGLVGEVEESAGIAGAGPETLPEAAAAEPAAMAWPVETVAPPEAVAGAMPPVEAAPEPAAPVEVSPPEVAPAAAAAAEAWVAPAPETILPAEPEEEEREGGAAFKVSAEVYHLDRNYAFQVYERGRITQKARIIVARLKPKIPSLPQFSFRWDYRYEHLNVDIHGVEPAVLEWWTMGQNGYTGHLPRRLAGPGYVFEAIIWLPVTFVFRGRLTLSGGSAGVDDPSSVASTTGGLRKLWSKWQGKPRP